MSYLRLPFQSAHPVHIFWRDAGLDLIPFAHHVVGDRGDYVLNDPVNPIQTGNKLIVLGETGEGILCSLQKVHSPESNPCRGIRKSVHSLDGRLLGSCCIRSCVAGVSFFAHMIPILQLGSIVFT